MRLGDLMQPGDRMFMKSEWAPASDYWPALSFSKRSVGNKIRRLYRSGLDYIVYAGTTNAANTKDPAHRSRLLSVVSIDHRKEHRTYDLIPRQSWEDAQFENAGRWEYSYSIVDAWEIIELPHAPSVAPRAYRELGNPANFGSIVELDQAEIESLASLEVAVVKLQKQPAALRWEASARYVDAPYELKVEISRMAERIAQREACGGSAGTRLYPTREVFPLIETHQMLFAKWNEQGGLCGLCRRPIQLPTKPGLLQPSPDRIDSRDPTYSAANVHITHLGCNYAKNEFEIAAFDEWLDAVSGP